MAMAGGINSGGLHGGASPPWPSGKVKPPTPAEETGATLEKVSTQPGAASEISKTTPARQVASPDQAKAAQQTAPAKPQTWQMSLADVVQQLVNQNIANTPENKQLAFLLMQYGVELSGENFEQAFKLLKGRKGKNDLESAAIAMAKGLTSSSKSVDFLSAFLSKNAQLAKQIQQFQQALANFQGAINAGKDSLNPSLLAGLTSIIGELDDQFKKLSKKAAGENINLTKISRGGIITDLAAFQKLLSGIDKQLAANNQGAEIRQKLSSLKNKILLFGIFFLRKTPMN